MDAKIYIEKYTLYRIFANTILFDYLCIFSFIYDFSINFFFKTLYSLFQEESA